VKGTEPLDELIMKVLGGDATPQEAEQVARWREEGPENQARYEAVQRVWTATHPAPLPGEVDLSVVPRIVQAAEERAGQAREIPEPRSWFRTPPIRWALPLAAAVAAVSLGVHQWSRSPASGIVWEASGSGSETFVLDDGSFVRLAPGSRLKKTTTGDERGFELEGRALFAVAHVEGRSFSVIVDGVETRVLGTRFEVRALPEGDTRIAVLEGRVEVLNARGRTELAAGEISVASPDHPPSRITPEDLLGLLDWPEGSLLFQNTPLAQVAREVGRQYGARVVVEGEALQGTRISAWYGTEPFLDVVQSLCAATNASCTLSDTLAVLR
jgi:transmembrane sensor